MTEALRDAAGNPIRDISDPYLVIDKTITLNGLSEEEARGRNVWGICGELLGQYAGMGKVKVKGGYFNGEIQQ